MELTMHRGLAFLPLVALLSGPVSAQGPAAAATTCPSAAGIINIRYRPNDLAFLACWPTSGGPVDQVCFVTSGGLELGCTNEKLRSDAEGFVVRSDGSRTVVNTGLPNLADIAMVSVNLPTGLIHRVKSYAIGPGGKSVPSAGEFEIDARPPGPPVLYQVAQRLSQIAEELRDLQQQLQQQRSADDAPSDAAPESTAWEVDQLSKQVERLPQQYPPVVPSPTVGEPDYSNPWFNNYPQQGYPPQQQSLPQSPPNPPGTVDMMP